MTQGSGKTIVANRPNILLITADQWRGDCLSAVNHPLVKTPNLDRLAATGVLFNSHFANAAPCSPARACLYTGLYQMNNRVCTNGTPLDSRHDTVAKAFRRQGYEPTLFGYTDQTEDPRSVPAGDPSMRTYEGVLPGFFARTRVTEDQTLWRSWLAQQGYDDALQSDPASFHIPVDGVDDPPSGKAPRYQAGQTDTAFLVAEFNRWLQEQTVAAHSQTNEGWFAHLSFLRPHPPFTVPEPYNRVYSASDVMPFKGSGSSGCDHPFLRFIRRRMLKRSFIPGAQGLVSDWQPEDFRQIAATYYGMCSEVDAQIGIVLDQLESTGQRDNTIIVFTSDHGEQMGDHGLLGKYGFYDASYHVPLIISDPFRPAKSGLVVNALTEAVDVLPTLLDMAGAPVPAQLDGYSMVPLMTDQSVNNWRQAAHWEYDFRDVAAHTAEDHFGLPSQACNLSVMRSTHYKYVHFAGMPSLLFDLQADPHETRNVIDEPDYQQAARTCAEALLSWRARHLDQSLALSTVTSEGLVTGARSQPLKPPADL